MTDQLGAAKDRKAYGAFGDETATAARVSALGYTTAEPTRKGYTGYEKDAESSLEFAQARYYSTTHGRYTSVDPLTASASIRNPQTFNRYTYVLNSPYKYTDPLGLLPMRDRDTGACDASNSSCSDDWGSTIWEDEEAVQDQEHTDEGVAANDEATEPDRMESEEPEPPPTPTAEQNSDPDPSYNCMAWALGITDQWIQPNLSPGTGEKQPGFVVIENRTGLGTGNKTLHPYMDPSSGFPLPSHFSMDDIAEFYGAKKTVEVKGGKGQKSTKHKASADSERIDGFYKLVVFETGSNETTHVMRQDTDGTWSSKNGAEPLVKGIKDAETYYNGAYGNPSAKITYYYRKLDKLGDKR